VFGSDDSNWFAGYGQTGNCRSAGLDFGQLRCVRGGLRQALGRKKPPAADFLNALVEAKVKKSLRDFL
jgi:hypothetical protein